MSEGVDRTRFVEFFKYCLSLRKEEFWTSLLNKPSETIACWKGGRLSTLFPSPKEMRRIIEELGSEDSMVVRLSEIEQLSLGSISTFSGTEWRNCYSLAEYLNLPVMEHLKNRLVGLSYKERGDVLMKALLKAEELQASHQI